MLQHTEEQLQAIYETMTENEKYMLLIGVFPFRLVADDLQPHESAALIGKAEVELNRRF